MYYFSYLFICSCIPLLFRCMGWGPQTCHAATLAMSLRTNKANWVSVMLPRSALPLFWMDEHFCPILKQVSPTAEMACLLCVVAEHFQKKSLPPPPLSCSALFIMAIIWESLCQRLCTSNCQATLTALLIYVQFSKAWNLSHEID